MKQLSNYLLLLFVFGMLGCIEEFDPKINESADLLVINGSVIKGDSIQTVIISKTFPYNSPDDAGNKISNCIVSVEDSDGNIFVFEENKKGVYQCIIPQDQLLYNKFFKLRVYSNSNDIFESEWELLSESSEIDSLYYAVEDYQNSSVSYDEGIRFYADIKAPEENTIYYKINVQETYGFKIVNPPSPDPYYWDNTRNLLLDNSFTRNYYKMCWKSERINQDYTVTTKNLTANQKKRIPLSYVGFPTTKFNYEYALLVKQYALTESAYLYFQQIQKFSADQGNLYQHQPAQIISNIYNIQNKDEKVLGFFWASSYTKKRLIFDRVYFTYSPEDLECLTTGYIYYWYLKDVDRYLYLYPSSEPFQYEIKDSYCYDCRDRGGIIKRPGYFID